MRLVPLWRDGVDSRGVRLGLAHLLEVPLLAARTADSIGGRARAGMRVCSSAGEAALGPRRSRALPLSLLLLPPIATSLSIASRRTTVPALRGPTATVHVAHVVLRLLLEGDGRCCTLLHLASHAVRIVVRTAHADELRHRQFGCRLAQQSAADARLAAAAHDARNNQALDDRW